MALPEAPNSRTEQYLAKIAGQNTALPEAPNSRVEQYLDYIAENGTVSEEEIAEQVSDWLEENIHEDPTVVIDSSLSVSGAAADAKAVGDVKSGLTVGITRLLSDSSEWQQGTLNTQGTYTDRVRAGESDTRIIVKARTLVNVGDTVVFKCPTGYKYRALFSANVGNITIGTSYTVVEDGYSDYNTWYTVDREIVVPEGAKSFFMALATVSDSDITPADLPDFKIYILTIGASVSEIKTDIEEMAKGYSETSVTATWELGYVAPNGSANKISSSTRCKLTKTIPIKLGDFVSVDCPRGMKSRITYWNSTTIGINVLVPSAFNSNWKSGLLVDRVPADAVVCCISVAFDDNRTMTTDDCEDIIISILSNDSGLDKKLISILGDSISTFAGTDAQTADDDHLIADGTYTYAGNHCRYPNAYMNSVYDSYWMQLIQKCNLQLAINDSWAGSKVTWDGAEGDDSGASKYIASPTRIGHLGENGIPDIILVQAGTNDIHAGVTIGTFNTESPVSYSDATIAALPVATFADAYRALLIRLQKAYPLARIIVMLPDYTTSYYAPDSADNYLEVIKEACDYFGVEWIDIRTSGITMYNTSYYLGDGIHPNINGMYLLCKQILSQLNNRV